MKPRYLKLDAGILSQKITLSNEFIQNIENEKVLWLYIFNSRQEK